MTEFPNFAMPQDLGASLASVPKRTLRSWLQAAELGKGIDGQVDNEVSSHQVLRAAALAHFKAQKKRPFDRAMAHHPLPDEPFVVVLSGKERVPIVVAVDKLPEYLRTPVTVVVFDARPICGALRKMI